MHSHAKQMKNHGVLTLTSRHQIPFGKKTLLYRTLFPMDETQYHFLKNQSDCFLEMAFRTDRDERLYNADAYGKNTGECGDSIEIFLIIKQGKIRSVSFGIDGCINTRASANMLAELIENKTPAQAWAITPDDIADGLETLPEESYHCAEIAAGALYLALSHYRTINREPWKKNYMPR